MYTGLLHTHNLFRWLVLIVAVIAIEFALVGLFGKRKWRKADNVLGMLLTIFVDIQLVVGMVLYLFVSPLTKAAFANFGAAMKNADLRFYAVEHILLMIIALVVIHIGRYKSKKASTAIRKHRAAAIFYSIGLIIILLGIPWSRPWF